MPALLPIASQVSETSGGKIGGSVRARIDSRANSKSTYSGLKVKASAQEPPKGNGSKIGGRIVQDGLVFRQNFSIRSYEIRADRTASMETVMNHFQVLHDGMLDLCVNYFSNYCELINLLNTQETALNHIKGLGLFCDGFGSTPEMCKKNLIWVVTKMQVVVDRYPTWGDVVQVDTWMAASGKNGLRRDWLVRDSNTGEILIRASSLCVMINKKTRRLSKIPDEVREEIECHFVDSPPVVDDDSRKLPKLDDNIADHIRTGLTVSSRPC
ncbi:hypothetical protein ACJIZ3_021162 [Penstemon smallii]|uniref:Acyl-[acyl-carrier-protein] hydrolase n=1 Tax=Penstemon smallii TaxID=265156 RepID=A0ABD3SLK2_9LAMI